MEESLRRMAIKAEEINAKISAAYRRLEARVGKEKADELMAQFQQEASAQLQPNHEYIIQKMDGHGLEDGFSEDEIRQQARDFIKRWMPKWEKYCEVCNGRNCKNNDSCIHCGCQF